MNFNPHANTCFHGQALKGNSASSIRLKGEVLAFDSNTFNPIVLPFFIRR